MMFEKVIVWNKESKDGKLANLLDCISCFPGIGHRKLLGLTGMSNGVLIHSLKNLERMNQLFTIRRNGRARGYYPVNTDYKEACIIECIKPATTRVILEFIIIDNDNNGCTFNDIVNRACKAPSSVHPHLKRLSDNGIITSARTDNRFHTYRPVNRDMIAELLVKYRKTFELYDVSSDFFNLSAHMLHENIL